MIGGTNYPFPGGMAPPMRPSHTPANAGPAGVVNQVPKGPGDSNGASSSASKADHNSSAAEADAPIAQSASSKKQPSENASKVSDAQTASSKKRPSANASKAADAQMVSSKKRPSGNASKAADAQIASTKKQPSGNASKAADNPSQAFRGMSLGGPEGSSRNPPIQQRRIAIPRPRLPTVEAAAAQEPRLREEIAVLQRTLEQLQPPVNPNEREEREVAAMERVVLRNSAWVARFLVELQRGQAGAPPPPPQDPAPRHPQYVEALVPPKEPPSPAQAGKGDDEDMSNS